MNGVCRAVNTLLAMIGADLTDPRRIISLVRTLRRRKSDARRRRLTRKTGLRARIGRVPAFHRGQDLWLRVNDSIFR